MSGHSEPRPSREQLGAAQKAEYEAAFDRARATDDVEGVYKEAHDCHDLACLSYLDVCAGRLPVEQMADINMTLAHANGLLDGLKENPKFDEDVVDGVPRADLWDPPEHECQ